MRCDAMRSVVCVCVDEGRVSRVYIVAQRNRSRLNASLSSGGLKHVHTSPCVSETFRVAPLMCKRTIRTPDDGVGGTVGGACVCGAAAV